MTSIQLAKIEALQHAINVCKLRQSPLKAKAYNVACDDIIVFLEATITRVEMGEDMTDYAYVQQLGVARP